MFKKSLVVAASIFLINSSIAHGFMGMMPNPMQMAQGMMQTGMSMVNMNPGQMMLQMCDSPMGQMGSSMANMMTGMMPNLNSGMAQMMKPILRSKGSTLKALDCARRNSQMIDLMLKAMNQDRQLLHMMGSLLVVDKDVAGSMMDLAHGAPQVGHFLISNVDSILFAQISYAMSKDDELNKSLVNLIYTHQKSALRYSSPLVRTMFDWRDPNHTYDGNEVAHERMIQSIFSRLSTAKKFMEMIQGMDVDTQAAIMDGVFLGKVHFYNPRSAQWSPVIYQDQGQYNLYALIKGIANSLGNGNWEDLTPETVSDNGFAFMMSMMHYMIDENRKPTPWGKAFLQALVDAVYVHSYDPAQKLMEFLGNMMKDAPGFQHSMPQPNPDSPAPRNPMSVKPPLI